MRSYLAPLLLLALASCSPSADSHVPAAQSARPQPTTSATQDLLKGTVDPRKLALAPMNVGNGVMAPVVIRRVEPNYERCAGEKLWGFPILEAVIDEQGAIRDLRLLKEVHPCLKKVLLEAIKQWEFRPGTFNGKPVAVRYNLTVHIHYR